MNDFERVAVFDRHLIQNLSRDDLKIALDRDLARVEPQFTQHSSNAKPGRYSALLTVNFDRDTGVDFHRDRNRSAAQPAQTPSMAVEGGLGRARLTERCPEHAR